jgi:hypothetical protein
MSLDKALKNLKFDVRMTEFNVDNGVVTKEELTSHLNKLPDSSANSEALDLEENGRAQSESAQH